MPYIFHYKIHVKLRIGKETEPQWDVDGLWAKVTLPNLVTCHCKLTLRVTLVIGPSGLLIHRQNCEC